MTGGFYRESGVFDGPRASTEILSQDASQWVLVLTGELPYPAKYISGTTLDNRLIMAGKLIKWLLSIVFVGTLYLIVFYLKGGADRYDQILEWEPATGQWKQLGKLNRGRYSHGMSVIDVADVIEFCSFDSE